MKSRFGPLILGLFMVIGSGCSKSSNGKKSPVYSGAFDPENTFRNAGFNVLHMKDAAATENNERGYRWRSWQGVVVSNGTNDVRPEVLANLIRASLRNAIKNEFRDEIVASQSGAIGDGATSGTLRYRLNGNTGVMHVWLIPELQDGRIIYVVHLREDKEHE